MKSILRYAVFAVFCGLLMIQAAAAQDKPTPTPTVKPDDGKKSEKPDKTDKKNNGVAPVTLEDLAVNFPDVEGWEKSEIQKYPTEELGFSINYESRNGGRVTVYVYDGGKKNIPSGVDDKVIKNELNAAKGEIQRVVQMGYYENAKEVKNETVTLGGETGKVKALRSLYKLTAGGRDLTSEIYIFGHDKRFIKIRATRPFEDKDEAGSKAVASLFSEIDAMFSK